MSTYTAPTPVTAADLTPAVFAAFAAFINQRPGLEPRNYFDPYDLANGRRQTYLDGRRAYQAEARSIQKQGTRARAALALAQSYPFDPVAMLEAFRAFSGRLSPVTCDCRQCSACESRCICAKCNRCTRCTDHAPGCKGCKVPPGAVALEYCTGQYFPTEYRQAAAVVLENYCDLVRPKRTPQPSDRFDSIADLAAANHAAGQYWFDRGTKRFFRSRVLPALYKGAGRLIWFVSSEQRDDQPREFTVRVFDTTNAHVDTCGEFGEFKMPGPAQVRARSLAKRDIAGEHVQVAQQAKCEFCGHYGHYCSGSPVASESTPEVA